MVVLLLLLWVVVVGREGTSGGTVVSCMLRVVAVGPMSRAGH